MEILFVNNQHMNTNSGIHVFNLANHLVRMGVGCVVAVPKKKNMVLALGQPLFKTVEYRELFGAKKMEFDIIHVWTPRELVRKITRKLVDVYACPYLVHLEDNEEYLAEAFTGRPISALEKIPPCFLIYGLARACPIPECTRIF